MTHGSLGLDMENARNRKTTSGLHPFQSDANVVVSCRVEMGSISCAISLNPSGTAKVQSHVVTYRNQGAADFAGATSMSGVLLRNAGHRRKTKVLIMCNCNCNR